MLTLQNPNKEILVKEDFLQLKWEENNKLLVADWTGWLDTTKAQKGCRYIVKAVTELSAFKILNDNSKVTGHSGDTRWMNRVWFPALKDAGLQYFGWVYSHEFFTQLEIDNTVDLTTGIAIKTFMSSDDARGWLETF
ncbi:hypothetical protein H9Q13_02940 [Pontibacter sp. JH31]|uniref:STAS/SEC14 domain-containing protein n=1 Tax=Pontibacter aquaedesilientis TaxID=2766980 RepID=A0ABR7XCT9_9BACT|nr:hypothetical protein [Pontibacter aquaedesilientis]MBD1396110.1 hypothetical protein [Pontibacter aquaedesilientis]